MLVELHICVTHEEPHLSKASGIEPQTKTHLLTEELSFGAFISMNWFLIITSSPAQAAAALTSSSDRP